MPPTDLSHYIFETNMKNKPQMDRMANLYKHNHCVKKHVKATKHNYITTAIIRMRTLAASSWCLEHRRRGGRNGEQGYCKSVNEFEFVCQQGIGRRKQSWNNDVRVQMLLHNREKCLLVSSYLSVRPSVLLDVSALLSLVESV